MAIVLHHSKAAGTDKVVLLGIANHEGDGGSWPAVATLAKYAQCSERAVRYSLKRLVEAGELSIVRQGGGRDGLRDDRRPNLYRVLVSCPADCSGGMNHQRRDEAGFPPKVDGVKPVSERGEAGFRDGVKQVAAEPSLEPSKNNRPKRTSQMTEDWQPNPENLKRIREKHPTLDHQREIENFRDHYISKGEKRADWDASLRTWMRNAEKWSKPDKRQTTGSPQFPAGSGGVFL